MYSLKRMALCGLLLVTVMLFGAAISAAADPVSYDTYDQSLFVDVDWYRASMIAAADLWNGGLDGQSGMGVYKDNFNGFFHVNLDQRWRQMQISTSTTVAQSRGIYMNVEAYRAAGPEEGERFLNAVNMGVDFLLREFRDPDDGGFFWEVSRRGTVRTYMKHGYGNVHPLMVLAQAYAVTQNPEHLQAALDQLQVIETHFLDPNFECAVSPGFARDFTEVIGVNNVDVYTHFFEALLALYDVTEGDQQAHVSELINRCGSFLVNTLYQDQEGFTDRGYVAYNLDENWLPSQQPYTRETQWSGAQQATTGHNIELAYLLSRAVERGFDPAWLDTADKLLRFCTEYALDPETGGMIYEIMDYNGQPLEGNPDNPLYIWWAQAETSRALLHFLVVRGVDDYTDRFKRIEDLFHAHLTDQEYGGLYQALDSENSLQPVGLEKGNVWKVNYHYSMFFTEVLRLQAEYPEQIAELNGR